LSSHTSASSWLDLDHHGQTLLGIDRARLYVTSFDVNGWPSCQRTVFLSKKTRLW
jgi:hypothetical protein